MTVDASVVLPPDFELRFYSGQAPTGDGDIEKMRAIEPGQPFTTVGTLPVGSTCYNAMHWVRLSQGDSKPATNVQSFEILGLEGSNTPSGNIPAMPQSMVDDAIAKPLSRYHDTETGSAEANSAWFGPVATTLALAAYVGNTTADARLVQQMKFTIAGNNEPGCTAGYPSQHELHVIAMYAIASRIPRIWDALSDNEKARVDSLMKGALIANAFVSSDNNPYIMAKTQQRDLRGGTNLSRTWNPNHRFAKPATVLVAMTYFGGPAATNAILKAYSHSGFLSELSSRGFTSSNSTLYRTFNWKNANPNSNAPTGAMIESAVKDWVFFGKKLDQVEAIMVIEGENMWNRTVNTGLNNGSGINGCGRMLGGQSGLPNAGVLGMANELDTMDANGARSAMTYVMGGYRVMMDVLSVLMVHGYWNPSSATVESLMARSDVGVTDMMYKSEHGYKDYHKGSCRGDWTKALADTWGWSYSFGFWTHVVRPYHGL